MLQLVADIAVVSLIMFTVTLIAYWRNERKGWKK